MCVLSRVRLFRDPMHCSPPGFSVHGILQARILESAAIPSSRGSFQPRDWTQVSHIGVRFFTIWATRAAQKYWSKWPIPSPGDLPDPGINQGLLHCRQILYQLSYQGARKTKVCVLVTLLRPTLWLQGLQPTRLFCEWNFSGKNTGVGCHFLLQMIPRKAQIYKSQKNLSTWQENLKDYCVAKQEKSNHIKN